ncbi:NAD(P)-dependent oxidoreductase [Burkholderia multivorans]|nr:NAD(P)-dependent oxidoreductase [Burkholderia multivorans]
MTTIDSAAAAAAAQGPDVTQVGVVGLGRMGTAFAKNLVADGIPTVVYDLDPLKAEALGTIGAEVADGWGALAKCGLVLSVLPDDPAALDASERLSEVLRTSAVHLSMSTISPSTSRDAARLHGTLGQGYVAAPVLGNPDLAAARQVFVLVSGDSEDQQFCMPILERLSQRVFSIGEEPGLASTLSLAGNALAAATLQSMGEILTFVRKAGIDSKLAFSVLTESLFDGRVHKTYGGKIVEQSYSPPGMTVPLAIKNLHLALAEAESVAAPMPVTSIVHDRLVTVLALGWAELDWSALGKLAELNAGLAPSVAPR